VDSHACFTALSGRLEDRVRHRGGEWPGIARSCVCELAGCDEDGGWCTDLITGLLQEEGLVDVLGGDVEVLVR